MPEYVIDLWLDGYDSPEEMEDACDEFIYDQLNFTASSVKVKRLEATKVYVLTESYVDEHRIIGVYATKKLAKKIMRRRVYGQHRYFLRDYPPKRWKDLKEFAHSLLNSIVCYKIDEKTIECF